MKLTEEQFDLISDCLPRQRGNVIINNYQLVNALLYVMENDCKWRSLPESFGNWHTIYIRINRWGNSGVLRRFFKALKAKGIIQIKIEAICPNSTK